jgi:AraC-like DNA-binding protein
MRRNFYEVYRTIDEKSEKNGLEIRWAGFASCPANFELNRYHKRYLLIYILEGLCVFDDDGEEREIGAGHILVFRPNEHQYYKSCGEKTLKYYGLSFNGRFIDSVIDDMPIMAARLHNIGLDDALRTQFHEFITEMLVQPKEHVEIIWGQFFHLLGRLNSAIVASHKQNSRNYLREQNIQKAAQFICQNYNLDLSIHTMAEISGYSVSWFENLFHQQYLMSPVNYQIKQRVDKAKEMIGTSLLNISEIGYAVGFKDPLYFSKIFKKHTGVSPMQYRAYLMIKKREGNENEHSEQIQP